MIVKRLKNTANVKPKIHKIISQYIPLLTNRVLKFIQKISSLILSVGMRISVAKAFASCSLIDSPFDELRIDAKFQI